LVGVLGEPYIYHHLEDVTRIGEDFGVCLTVKNWWGLIKEPNMKHFHKP